MSNPTVDILMATYNGERYLAEQVESIQAQSFQDWRLLVSDDCSTDGTPDVLGHLAASDSRVRIASSGVRRGGARENFLSLVPKAEAPYVMFCDQDDVWLPKKIELTLAKMRELEAENGPNAPLLVFTDMRVVDADLNVIAESFERYSAIDSSRVEFRQVLAQSIGAGCTMMCNRALIDVLARTPEHAFMVMHDWWLSIVAAAFGKIGHVDEPTSLYRQHGVNSVGAIEFSVSERARHLDLMRERFSLTVWQAGSFARIYGDALSSRDRGVVDSYAAISNCGRLKGLLLLFSSGCWKLGPRKCGQIIGVLCGVGAQPLLGEAGVNAGDGSNNA